MWLLFKGGFVITTALHTEPVNHCTFTHLLDLFPVHTVSLVINKCAQELLESVFYLQSWCLH